MKTIFLLLLSAILLNGCVAAGYHQRKVSEARLLGYAECLEEK